MSALAQLANRLRDSETVPAGYRALLGHGTDVLNQELRTLEAKFQAAGRCLADTDQIRQSLQVFIQHGRLTSLRNARRVCFGLATPITDDKSSLFNDRRLFLKILDDADGVGQWLTQPRAFRRCYRGLAASYFAFDADQTHVTQAAKHNRLSLRDYLHAHADATHCAGREPDWLTTLDRYRHVFTAEPFGDLPRHALAGDKDLLQRVFDDLLIDGNSWFQRKLLLEQIRHTTTWDDAGFVDKMDQQLSLVDDKLLIRDEALALLLDRYMQCVEHPEHKTLRDAAVSWWGNPWLPSQELHWGRVDKSTRNTVAHWLQKEFIDAFFSKMASNGANDRRRAAFWSRYIGTFADLKFGLSCATLRSHDEDLRKLVQKMDGLYGPMASNTAGDAFVMIWGQLAVVEFSGYSNAVYGYDTRRGLPFVIEKGRPLRTTVDVKNSLKQSSKVLWLQHQDSIRGFDTWEDRFAAELKTGFGIVPAHRDKPIRSATKKGPNPSSPPNVPETPQESLDVFTRRHHLRVEDLRPKGGNLWIYARNDIRAISDRLRSEGFKYKAGKGWWKKT